jgi:hypothetical protein
MTTIVKHRRTGNEYILLSINGEADKNNPSRFISGLFNQEKSEVSSSATVCDIQGNIFLAYIDELVVTEIDGKKPAEILPERSYQSVDNDIAQQPTEFEPEFERDEELSDDEFESEEFDDEQDTPAVPQKSFLEGLGSPIKSDIEDDEDWV